MRLQESIDLGARTHTEQPPKFGLREAARAIGFQGHGFERLALDVTGGAGALSDVIGNEKNEVLRLPYHDHFGPLQL